MQAAITEELHQNKAFLQGYDRAGHPLTIVIVKRHFPQPSDGGEMCKRFITFVLDAAVRLGSLNPDWDGQGVCILDLSGE